MQKKLLSASEIAQMGLPGLPKTKANIIARADKEGWYFEESTGQGGMRRVYRVPEHYFSQSGSSDVPTETKAAATELDNKVVGTIVAGTSQVDLEILQMVETVLDEVLQARGLQLKSERRGAVVAFLYDYVAKGGGKEGMHMALKAIVA